MISLLRNIETEDEFSILLLTNVNHVIDPIYCTDLCTRAAGYVDYYHGIRSWTGIH